MNKKSGLNLILLSFIFVSSLMFVSALDFDAGTGSLDATLPGWWYSISTALGLGETYGVFFISLIIAAILIVALYDILVMTSIFDEKVTLVISIGLGLIFILTGMINMITIVMTQVLAGLGAFAIWLEIGLAILIFIGLSIGSGPIQRWAAKRYANRLKVKAMKSSGKVNAATRFLKDITRESVEKK